MPNSVRLPILTDEERHQVGLRYKEQGSEAAVRLGHQLVCGEIKQARVQAWISYLEQEPQAALFCWRGGMRSQIAQRWLQEAGYPRPRVAGGYKALRNASLRVLEAASQTPMLILSGRTGSGKTDLLVEQGQGIDLEGAARHRGSAFGQMQEPQPEPVEFEARLAVQLQQKAEQRYWLLEDEGRMIGRLGVPHTVRRPMLAAPVVVLDVPMQDRIAQIHRDYVQMPMASGQDPQQILASLRDCLARVRRRLGEEPFERIDAQLVQAFSAVGAVEQISRHQGWIAALLEEYYDPMYDYAIAQKKERTIFRGDKKAVLDFLRSYRPPQD